VKTADIALRALYGTVLFIGTLVIVQAPARALDPSVLTNTAMALISNPVYAPDSNGTHCNLFVHDFLDQALNASIPEMGPSPPSNWDANQIYTQLALSAAQGTTWKDVTGNDDQRTYDSVTQLATRGALILAAWPDPSGPNPHGHLAIVMPVPEVPGYFVNNVATFQVPVIAQAGAAACNTNGVFMNLGLSCGFGPSKRANITFFEYIGPGS
jgi:hypothetical protein